MDNIIQRNDEKRGGEVRETKEVAGGALKVKSITKYTLTETRITGA